MDIASIIERFSTVRVAIVGDFFLDQYLVIDPALDEPSIETGLSAHQVVSMRHSPGAAGTVANNLSALDAAEIHAVGIVGDDGHGYLLRRELESRRVTTDCLIASRLRFTPTYTKPMFKRPAGEVEGERIDVINRTPTPPDLEEAVIRHVESIAKQVDAVIVLDQVTSPDVGVVTRRVRSAIRDLARMNSRTIFYADSRASIGEFQGSWTKPNEREALLAVGMSPSAAAGDQTIREAGRQLAERTGKPVFLTRGEKGILVSTQEGQTAVPAPPVSGPVDICGAGDSATAGIVLALCSGASVTEAAMLGNLVASKTIVQIGTTGTTTRGELLAHGSL
jgi:rfaE bifunctional protein kinase chain/domain